MIPRQSGPFRARVYRPASGARERGVVVAHGVHYRGIDEPRLLKFVRTLARSGFVVLTPELSELSDYRLTVDSTARIQTAVTFLERQKQWVTPEPLGLIGFSFAGGLSLVAAANPSLSGSLSYVMNVGGHHDLARVLTFLLTDRIETPNGVVRIKAHDYGLAVLLYGYLDRFVPADELPTAQAAFRAWLHEDRSAARRHAELLESEGPGRRLFKLLEARQLRQLANELQIHVQRDGERLAALSPRGKLQRVRAPVYLLHGSLDSVIPSSEAAFAKLELGSAEHAALISPLIEHVEVGKHPSLLDELRLLMFMSQLF